MKKRGVSKQQFGLWEKKEQSSAEYSTRYRERNPESASDAQKRYRETHREEIRARRRERYHANLAASRKSNRNKERNRRQQLQGGFHLWHLKHYYGPDAPEHYAQQMEKQHGACAACDCVPKRKLHFDHNHKTGQFRGLLCHKCNQALGCCDDNPARLRKLATYLEEWGVAAAA